MKVSEAMNSRQCVRTFTDQPVALADLRELLELAARAPSGGNLQPWKVHAVTGEAREARFCREPWKSPTNSIPQG